MITKITLKTLLKKYDIKPNKRMGQNFLIDGNVLEKIIETAEISPQDTILEVGPGLGILTQELVKKAKKVIAVEKDANLAKVLKETLKDYKNIEIIQGDILKINLPTMEKVVANIPYYLTSPLIRRLLEAKNPPQEMILMVQKEVAQRICAKPPKMNLLAIAVQLYSQPEIIKYVSKKSFWPASKVDSATVKIANIRKSVTNEKDFFKIVKAGFNAPRKQLANNLTDKLRIEKEEIKRALIKCGFNAQIRAQNLSVSDWEKLVKELGRLHRPEIGQSRL